MRSWEEEGRWVSGAGREEELRVVGGGSESGNNYSSEVFLCWLLFWVAVSCSRTHILSQGREKICSSYKLQECCSCSPFRDHFFKSWSLLTVRSLSLSDLRKMSRPILYFSVFMQLSRRMPWDSVYGSKEIYHLDKGNWWLSSQC